MFYVAVKSGTNGYEDIDNCDMLLTKIPSNDIPRKGDILEFNDIEDKVHSKYLVREIKRYYQRATEQQVYAEFIYVYVINA
ncbi:hypothetical protein [Paenibacillus gallinarum]|uniref:ASCH domain-containing protein n=1 Tax=Paenibacillus gallinarum TaxID=2762232 RepID=A0ABR8T393_9BACL|nr:hypothetical protein [Paenibacillus gallinarum]MBD7970246.1 hypothetical protein [Paenibacillus gallinarum]